MTQCKPCITIRDITKIIWNNSKLFVSNVKRDIQSYSSVNATVCVLDKPVIPYVSYDEEMIRVRKIREQAMANHIPTSEEFYEELRKDLKFQFKEEDRERIEEAFSKAIDQLNKNMVKREQI